MRNLFVILSCLLISCNTEKKQEKKTEKEFQMYEMTEMALLMEQMYNENKALRTKIINEDSLGDFPQKYQNIFSAVMTEPSENDEFFKNYAQLFIESQKKIHQEKGKEKENFNAMVNVCISCHDVKCTGPIVRIKKLYIK
jgi:hypothetical protein